MTCDGEPVERILATRGWLAEQPPSLRQEIFSRGRTRCLSAGAVIFEAGDPPDGLYAVVTGQIKLVYYLPEGQEVVLWVAEPGFWFGIRDLFAPRAVRYAAAVATHASTVFHLPKKAFTDLVAEEPRRAFNFAAIMSHNLLLALRYIAEVVSQPPVTRVAQQLALLCGTAGALERGGYDLRLPQQDLAAMLGLSRVTVNKALRVLQAEGLITLGYGRIGVADVGRLAARRALGEYRVPSVATKLGRRPAKPPLRRLSVV